jgi:hypothetical protein
MEEGDVKIVLSDSGYGIRDKTLKKIKEFMETGKHRRT